jgi:hypothetical protein
MLRLLIRDITVVNDPESKLLLLQVRWQGGATDTIEVHRRPKRAEAIRYSDMFVAKIQAMAEKYNDQQIAAQLNSKALTSSTGKPFTVNMVRWIRFKHRIPGPLLSPGKLRARFAKDMASADGSSITGSNTASSLQHNASQIRHMPSQSMTPLTGGCKNGWRTPDIFVHHPQRKLFEVHYARTVRMLSGRCEPSVSGQGLSRPAGTLPVRHPRRFQAAP